jgi:2-polyprenyl-6-methoxyphenol hydroxylase-like FAD-dependent oxidoreductase
MESLAMMNAHNEIERLDHHQKKQEERGELEYEVELNFLLHLLYERVKDDTTFIFGDSITGLKETPEHMEVSFKN